MSCEAVVSPGHANRRCDLLLLLPLTGVAAAAVLQAGLADAARNSSSRRRESMQERLVVVVALAAMTRWRAWPLQLGLRQRERLRECCWRWWR
jgi:hypothetical protein